MPDLTKYLSNDELFDNEIIHDGDQYAIDK